MMRIESAGGEGVKKVGSASEGVSCWRFLWVRALCARLKSLVSQRS